MMAIFSFPRKGGKTMAMAKEVIDITALTTTDISREDRDRLDGLAPWEVRKIVLDINAEVDRRIRRAMGDFSDGPTIDATAEPVPDEAARLAGPKK